MVDKVRILHSYYVEMPDGSKHGLFLHSHEVQCSCCSLWEICSVSCDDIVSCFNLSDSDRVCYEEIKE